jgi:hypothetical protein
MKLNDTLPTMEELESLKEKQFDRELAFTMHNLAKEIKEAYVHGVRTIQTSVPIEHGEIVKILLNASIYKIISTRSGCGKCLIQFTIPVADA